MIQPLLQYQIKEKQKLQLLAGVEGGKSKRELDEGLRIIDTAKHTLLTLENDAKILLSTYESISKNIKDVQDKLNTFNKTVNQNMNETEAGEALGFVSNMLGRVAAYETQLVDAAKKINEKTNLFEETRVKAGRIQQRISALQAEYAAAKQQITPQIAAIDAELTNLAKNVDPRLIEKYKQIRKSNARGQDIVVPLAGNRCGGCHFELPLSLIHTITTNNFIVCEECGRIIFKDAKG